MCLQNYLIAFFLVIYVNGASGENAIEKEKSKLDGVVKNFDESERTLSVLEESAEQPTVFLYNKLSKAVILEKPQGPSAKGGGGGSGSGAVKVWDLISLESEQVDFLKGKKVELYFHLEEKKKVITQLVVLPVIP